MADQRHFRLAYRERSNHSQRRRGSNRARMRRLAEGIRIAVSQLYDDFPDALLDEEFDDLTCEPERLLQLANQL